VASQDNTTITVTPAVDMVGHPVSGGAFSVTLNRGQVYIGRATSALALTSIGGTSVTSNNDIAVTMANDLTSVLPVCGDINGDQLVPDRLAGQTFITLPGGLTAEGGTISDMVYVYPVQNNTVITVDGVVVATKNKGQYYEITNNGTTRLISTSKPAHVYQVGGFGCEVGGAVVPHVDCTGSTAIGAYRSSSETYKLNLLVKTGGEGSFTFNGNPGIITAAAFSTVPNTGGVWKWAQITLSGGQFPTGTGAIIKNTTPFHLGVINGGTTGGTRYGYFSNFGGFTPETDVTNNGIIDCNNSTVELSTSTTGTVYQWLLNGSNAFWTKLVYSC